MKINVSSNFKSGNWNGVKNHVSRNYLHDRNKGIKQNFSYMNQNLTQANSQELLNHHFNKFIIDHDKKVKSQGHKNREYKSVKNYLRKSKGNPTANAIIKFGNINNKTNLENKYGTKEVKEANNLGFKIYAEQFNKRHVYIEMAEAETNVDEVGADHLHYNLVCLGHTKKGKPSKSLSNALKCEYHTSNRILALKNFHKEDDNFLITCMNYSYQKIIDPKINFKLTRTNQPYHLSEKVYEKSKRHKKKLDNASRHQTKRINSIKPKINKSKQQIKKPIPKYIKVIHKIESRIRSISRRIINYIEEPNTNIQNTTNINQRNHHNPEIN